MSKVKILFTFLFFAKISAQNASNVFYCLHDDDFGIFVYNERLGKDDPYIAMPVTSHYEFNVSHFHNWTKANSLNVNLVDAPVLDKRWENFMSNHGAEPILQGILKYQQNYFISARVHTLNTNSSIFKEKKWYHFKTNASGIYMWNNTAEFRKIYDSSIFDIYMSAKSNIWKIHKYNYLYTQKNNTEFNIMQEKTKCNTSVNVNSTFSFYLAMCKNCTLKLRMISHHNIVLNITEKGSGAWARKDYNVKFDKNCFSVIVETQGQGKSAFWAISEVAEIGPFSCFSKKRYIKVSDDKYVCENTINNRINLSKEADSCTIKLEDYRVLPKTVNVFREATVLNLPFSTIVAVISIVVFLIVTSLPVAIFLMLKGKKKKTKKKVNLNKGVEMLLQEKPNSDYYETIDENPYDNVLSVAFQRAEFLKYAQTVCNPQSSVLQNQFFTFEKGYLKDHECALDPQNLAKNRFSNIVPYDCNRVVLKPEVSSKYFSGDYINATYIRKNYIQAQSPQENTVHDFWFMIWQENINNIVTITDEKFYMYWPKLNKTVSYAGMQISCQEVSNCQYYFRRKFVVNKDKESRQIQQLHYFTWNEDDVNITTQKILPFIDRLLTLPHYDNSPVLFHCLAGAGPSGTIILCDIVLREVVVTGSIDVYKVAKELRSYRIDAIANWKQYAVAHLIIRDHLHYNK